MLLACFSTQGNAALVVGGEMEWRVTPIQDLILIPGTPFNQTGSEVPLRDVAAPGVNRWTRQAQVGSQILMTDGQFVGSGVHPALGDFTLTTGAPAFTPMRAVLSNVVQDPAHPGFATGDPSSITAADIALTVANWGVRLDTLGVDLEVRDSFSFVGTLDGLPPSPGTIISDPFIGLGDRLNVYLAGTNTLIGYSENRRLNLSAVPEPSSLWLLSTTGLCLLRRRRR